jgi:hypothetical protein
MIELFPFMFFKKTGNPPIETELPLPAGKTFDIETQGKCLYDINITDGVNSLLYQVGLTDKILFGLINGQKATISIISSSSNDMFDSVEKFNPSTLQFEEFSKLNPFEINFSDLNDMGVNSFQVEMIDKQ